MFTKKTARDVDLRGKTVLIRSDLNVPVDEHGVITDDYRIRQALPTIEHVKGHGARVVVISHFGRPKGKKDSRYSLKPVATRLSDLMHLPVDFAEDCVGQVAKDAVAGLSEGGVLLLENLRFHPQEEDNDEEFAKELASLADIFVQDAFGVVHRKHASLDKIAQHLPSVAGFLLEKEVDTITNTMQSPERPLAVVIGGAKISDKIELLDKFVKEADFVAVVGGMANTFLLAEGVEVGKSLVEKDAIDTAKRVLAEAKERMQKDHFTFYLPQDVVVAKELSAKVPTRVVDIGAHTWADISNYPKQPPKETYSVSKEENILDVGPITAGVIAGALKMAKTAVWNGTAGVTEVKGINGAADPFCHGTKAIIEGLVGMHSGDCNKPFSLVGGGDTVGFVESIEGLRERLNHVSTGGGASLELMVGKSLPGVEVLQDKNDGN